jgi:cysteine desulfurase
MESLILQKILDVQFTGVAVERLPNTSSLLIENIDGESLLLNLDLEGFSVSTGAACSSGSMDPSPVLLAMGLTRFEAQKSLRVSLGCDTTSAEIEMFVTALVRIVERLRSFRTEIVGQ